MGPPYTSKCRLQAAAWVQMLAIQGLDIRLTRLQGNQSAVAGVGDGDNSLSMRRVKSGACGAMIHAAGAGGGGHCAIGSDVAGVEKD